MQSAVSSATAATATSPAKQASKAGTTGASSEAAQSDTAIELLPQNLRAHFEGKHTEAPGPEEGE